jgi:hypothetical protein
VVRCPVRTLSTINYGWIGNNGGVCNDREVKVHDPGGT